MFCRHMRPRATETEAVIAGRVAVVTSVMAVLACSMVNDIREVLPNGDHNFAFYKLSNIDKCWYPDTEYQKMNYLEKRRLYFNQQKEEENPPTGTSASPQYLPLLCILK